MRANLPMYDLPEVRRATDAWWTGLACHFRAAGLADVPDRLERQSPPAWTAPDLLFSQTCGYPLTHALAGRVRLLCTPHYAAPGCDGARYSSALVVAESAAATTLADLRGGICAINARDSHSGCNVLRHMLAPLAGGGAFFTRVIETGSHVASLAAVAAGEADLCAVDAVTHTLLAYHAPARLTGTRVLGHSPPAPGLPCIAGPAVSLDGVKRLRHGIRSALQDPALETVRAELLIADAEVVPIEAYGRIVDMEHEAVNMGYPELR